MPVRTRALLIPAMLTCLATLTAACGSGGTSSPAPSASAPGGASAATGAIAVQAAEYKFEPATINATAGSVTFRVTNVGNEEHEFEIFKGETVVDEIEGLVPGLTRDLTVDLAAGDYTFVCKLPGHEEAGMKGTLTVGS
jgi:iron uptake system component EfeO